MVGCRDRCIAVYVLCFESGHIANAESLSLFNVRMCRASKLGEYEFAYHLMCFSENCLVGTNIEEGMSKFKDKGGCSETVQGKGTNLRKETECVRSI